MGGVTRLTTSLAVIMMEVSHEFLALPLCAILLCENSLACISWLAVVPLMTLSIVIQSLQLLGLPLLFSISAESQQ